MWGVMLQNGMDLNFLAEAEDSLLSMTLYHLSFNLSRYIWKSSCLIWNDFDQKILA